MPTRKKPTRKSSATAAPLDADKLSLMRHIKHLAEVYDEYVSGSNNASQAHRVGGSNPCYNQTDSGLFLEFYYGGPSKVWTPWGYWTFAAAQPYQADIEGFMSRLTVRVHTPEQESDLGVYGPVYAILAIDGQELLEPVLKTDRTQFLDYSTASAEWQQYFEAC